MVIKISAMLVFVKQSPGARCMESLLVVMPRRRACNTNTVLALYIAVQQLSIVALTVAAPLHLCPYPLSHRGT